MKRVICLLLVACFMVVALVSCSNKNDEQAGSDSNGAGNNAPATEKPTDEYGQESFTSVVPVATLDFEGDTLKILHRDSLPVQREWYKDVTEDDLLEAILNEYNIDKDTASSDIRRFVEKLIDAGIVE